MIFPTFTWIVCHKGLRWPGEAPGPFWTGPEGSRRTPYLEMWSVLADFFSTGASPDACMPTGKVQGVHVCQKECLESDTWVEGSSMRKYHTTRARLCRVEVFEKLCSLKYLDVFYNWSFPKVLPIRRRLGLTKFPNTVTVLYIPYFAIIYHHFFLTHQPFKQVNSFLFSSPPIDHTSAGTALHRSQAQPSWENMSWSTSTRSHLNVVSAGVHLLAQQHWTITYERIREKNHLSATSVIKRFRNRRSWAGTRSHLKNAKEMF